MLAGRVPLPPHTVVTLCPHRPICRSHGPTHRDCALGPSSDVSKYSCADSWTVRSQPNFASPGARVPDPSVTAQGLSRPCPPPAKRPPGPAGPAARGPHPAQVCPSERSLLTAEVGVPGKSTKQGLGFNAANTLKLDINVKVTLSSLTHLENWKVLPGVPCPPAADPAPPLALAFAGPPGTRACWFAGRRPRPRPGPSVTSSPDQKFEMRRNQPHAQCLRRLLIQGKVSCYFPVK